jgi:molybdopterin converting factor small subunit
VGPGPRRHTHLSFAALKPRRGRDRDEVELPPDVTCVADLARFLPTFRPALAGALAGVRIAVGDEFATPSRELFAGDVVGLLPPVSGG